MSGLYKPNPGGSGIDGTVADPVGPGGVIVDPLTEITQPGGPFPVGHAILADGLGGYSLAATLRPYDLGFALPGSIPGGGSRFCDFQGVATSLAGYVVTLATNIIGISVAVNVAAVNTYAVQILLSPTAAAPVVLATLSLDGTERTDFRRDLSVAVAAGAELGARLVRTAGAGASSFNRAIIGVELET